MERKFSRRWGLRNVTVKVTNEVSGRTDIHRNISKEEICWIESNPSLKVEVLGVKFFKKKNE